MQTKFTRPRLSAARVVYNSPFFRVYRRTADFGEYKKTYFVNDYRSRAAVLLENQGRLLLVRQYRLLINGLSWEIPGGAVDEGESPKAAAIRECLEETGVRVFNPKPLIFFHPGLDTVHSPTSVFYGREFSVQAAKRDRYEIEQRAWMPIKRCIEMIFKRRIQDSLTISAIMAYKILLEQAGS